MKVTVIGGGTGSSNILLGLKKYKDLDLTVVVNMTDDGGSNKLVRDEYGILPMSDLRKSILALSNENQQTLRNLFTYRFAKGVGLEGHTLGNLIMMVMSEITGSEKQAVAEVSALFDVVGTVVPVTYDDIRLVAELDDGSEITGEHLIDDSPVERAITRLYTNPSGKINPDAAEAIETADFIIVGPGDVYTSTLANFVIDGFKDSFSKSQALKILIPNLVSKIGQSRGLHAQEYLDIFEEYGGSSFDYILFNNGRLPPTALSRYLRIGEHLVENNLTSNKAQLIEMDLVAQGLVKKVTGDKLVRSLIRHDPDKLGVAIYSIISSMHADE